MTKKPYLCQRSPFDCDVRRFKREKEQAQRTRTLFVATVAGEFFKKN
jgi:hypothetical protein